MIFLLPIFRLVSFLFVLLNAREGATFFFNYFNLYQPTAVGTTGRICGSLGCGIIVEYVYDWGKGSNPVRSTHY